ncbi:hypothetical protein C8R43DRAFT_944876 [Mycena crocata]|nr:hypothetical protein C8R43DRAFT_944876 [Mycena crocata]
MQVRWPGTWWSGNGNRARICGNPYSSCTGAPMTGRMGLYGGGESANTTEPPIFILGAMNKVCSCKLGLKKKTEIVNTWKIRGLRNYAHTLIETHLRSSVDRRAESVPQASAEGEVAWVEISERDAPESTRTQKLIVFGAHQGAHNKGEPKAEKSKSLDDTAWPPALRAHEGTQYFGSICNLREGGAAPGSGQKNESWWREAEAVPNNLKRKQMSHF